MDTKNSKKGDALEKAVKLINEAVLDADPKTKGTEFTVETNLRDMSSGVLHEIDVLVKTRPGSEYEAKFIFECKNWGKPVGKNEVMILAKKVDALKANHGFLVAKTLSKHAKRQIDLEQRISFIRCSEDFLSPLNSAELIHVDQEVFPPAITIKWRICSDGSPTQLDYKKITCLYNGQPINFLKFIDSQLKELILETRKENPLKFIMEGTHEIKTVRGINFSENELLIDGWEVETMIIPFHSIVKCQRRKLISKFELEGRGQAFTFEPIDIGHPEGPLEIQIVKRLKDG